MTKQAPQWWSAGTPAVDWIHHRWAAVSSVEKTAEADAEVVSRLIAAEISGIEDLSGVLIETSERCD